jgi:ligand-binding SRPBCC domain-containing protein
VQNTKIRLKFSIFILASHFSIVLSVKKSYKMRKLEFKQFLPLTVEEAWEFFSNPANLCKITPTVMNFVITSRLPEKVYPGLIITYKVSPVFSIPITWVTEITQVNEPFYFVDDQRSGPYSIWHHEHHFEVVENGVMMTDKLFYKVPFGVLGNLLDWMFIHKKVLGIFEFRKKVLETDNSFF